MTAGEFTLDDLRRILRAAAGADESVDLDGDILETEFEALNYESLALLETCGRIEREYGISLDDIEIDTSQTPGGLIALVNARLSAVV